MSHHLPDTLTHTLSSHLGLGKSRLQTLSWLIIGLVNTRTVNLSHLASQCSGGAQVSSSYRRLQRFFQYVRLEGGWLALAVVKLLKIRPPWVLCLDRTNWKVGRRDVNILMLAVVTRRLRIPLMWTVLDKAGSSNQCERIALMRRYLALFGPRSIAWLLADREFMGREWIEFLLKNNIMFAIRVKENSLVRLDDGRCFQLKSLLRRRKGIKWLQERPARLDAMADSLGTPLTFAAKRLGDGQLLIVATNGRVELLVRAALDHIPAWTRREGGGPEQILLAHHTRRPMTPSAGGVGTPIVGSPARARPASSAGAAGRGTKADRQGNMNHRNSLRRARLVKTAYFARRPRTTASKPIGHSCLHRFINHDENWDSFINYW